MNDLPSGQKLDPAVDAPPEDLTWESELVQLLSTLESFRAQLYDDCLAGRSLPAVEALLAVAKGVTAFVRSRFGDATASRIASADAFLAAARLLHDRFDDDVFKALWRFVRRRREERDPREQFADAASKLRAVLSDAFALCGGRFVSSTARAAWTETYTVFLEDMDDLIEQVQP